MMNIFALILGLTPVLVQGIQTVVGDKASGATKQQMAKDALSVAVAGATNVLTGNNAAFANVAGAIAGLAIDQTVAIAKASGAYGKWTAIATASQQDINVAAGVMKMIEQYTNPAPVVAPPEVVAPMGK